MKHAALPAACLALALVFLPGHAAAEAMYAYTASKLARQLMKGDCTGAVESLNSELADKTSQAFLVAGNMYEQGLCVVRSWSRAVGFYEQAHEGGERAAAYRLASGFAAPENGPDFAAALWWAGKARHELVGGCSAGATDDPDRFVAQLRGWSKQRLEQCNYVVGVMSMIVGDLQYPRTALRAEVEVDVTLRFRPAVPALEMKVGDGAPFQVLAEPAATLPPTERKTAKRIEAEMKNTVGDVARRAIARYPQPSGIDPGAEMPLLLKYNLM